MKKIIVMVLSFLIIIFLITATYVYTYLSQDMNSFNYDKIQETIMENSNWITLSKEDINAYVADSYSDSISTIISSLENSIPIILEISQNKFSNTNNNGTFVILSAFTKNNNVIFYQFDTSTKEYVSGETSFGSMLENATKAFIVTNPEVLK